MKMATEIPEIKVLIKGELDGSTTSINGREARRLAYERAAGVEAECLKNGSTMLVKDCTADRLSRQCCGQLNDKREGRQWRESNSASSNSKDLETSCTSDEDNADNHLPLDISLLSGIQNLSVGSDSDDEGSENQDENSQGTLVSKSPNFPTKNKKISNRQKSSQPYPGKLNIPNNLFLLNGGNVFLNNSTDFYLPNIPVSVIEHSDAINIKPNVETQRTGGDEDLMKMIGELFNDEDNKKMYTMMDNIVDNRKSCDSIKSCSSPRDSNYESMSPTSSFCFSSPGNDSIQMTPEHLYSSEFDVKTSKHVYSLPSASPGSENSHGYSSDPPFQTILLNSPDSTHHHSHSKRSPVPQLSTSPSVSNSKTLYSNYRGSKLVDTIVIQPASVKHHRLEVAGVAVSEYGLDKPSQERLLSQLKTLKKEHLWITVCMEKKEDAEALNDKKQTRLMSLLAIKERVDDLLERVYTRLQWIRKEERVDILKQRDINNQNALYLAALCHKDKPIIARYIADSYAFLNADPDEYLDDNNNGLLHKIAATDDSYAQVLAELLHSRHEKGKTNFNVNRFNKRCMTPLHVAARRHSPMTSTLSISKLLVRHGASLATQDDEGRVSLHYAISMSCDPELIKILLQNPVARESINIPDRDKNTPLHLAFSRNDLSRDLQRKVISQLLTSGASQSVYNNQGKLPCGLLSPERKEAYRTAALSKQKKK